MDAEAVILAAGESRRMGSPKALVDVGGEPALARLARACAEAGVASAPIVVLGAHAAQVRAALPDLRARWVENPRPEAGRTGSLQRGLQAARAQTVLVLPVDHPLVEAATLRALLAAPGAWVVPTRGGRGGHPLKLSGVALAAVETAPPEVALRDLPAMAGLDVVRVPVEDEGIHLNLDTPDDLARALRRKGI